MTQINCQCGELYGEQCAVDLSLEPERTVEYVPAQHRETATALRSPAGLTESITVAEYCARRILADYPGAAWVVDADE